MTQAHQIPLSARLGLVTLAAALLLSAAASQAQPTVTTGYASQARGVDPESLYTFDGVESINVYNGNLSLTVPLGPSYPLNGGQSYSFNLRYNANAWEPRGVRATPPPPGLACDVSGWIPDPHANAGLGWVISFGRLLEPLHDEPGVMNDHENSGNNRYWAYEAPDGSRYQIKPANDTWDLGDGAALRYDGSDQLAGASGRLRFRTGAGVHTLEFPDGSIHEFTNLGAGTNNARWRATRISYGHPDLGNFIEIDYDMVGNRWAVTDSMNRTHSLVFDQASQTDNYEFGRLLRVELAGHAAHGEVLEYQIETVSVTLPMHRRETAIFANSIDVDPNGSNSCDLGDTIEARRDLPRHPAGWNYTVDLLQRIVMPDGLFYQFYYFENEYPEEAYGKSGAIKQLRYPTGLRRSYRYTEPDREFSTAQPTQGYAFNYRQLPEDEWQHYAANTQSGILDKHTFTINENTANWTSIFNAPESGSGEDFGVWTYDQTDANYESTYDLFVNPSLPPGGKAASTAKIDYPIDIFRPCYYQRSVTDPLGRRTDTFYNNVGFLGVRSGQPFTMCDPLLEIGHSEPENYIGDGVDNYFGPPIGGHDMPDTAAEHFYELNGAGPFLSKLIRDENGHIIRSEWVRMENITEREPPLENHTVDLWRETRYHAHRPDDPGCVAGVDSYHCYPVVARAWTENQRYDGLGHFGLIHREARRLVDGDWLNWGNNDPANDNHRRTESEYRLTDPAELSIDFAYGAACSETGGCAQLVGGGLLVLDDLTRWWETDAMTKETIMETGGGSGNFDAVAEYCYDPIYGIRVGERRLVDASRGPDDVYTRHVLDNPGNQANGNIRETLVFGGDDATLSTASACPGHAASQAVTRTAYEYEHGIQVRSASLDANGALVTESARHQVDANTGWIDQTTHPSGVVIVYQHDAVGRLTASQVGGKAILEHRYSFPRWDGNFINASLNYQAVACAPSAPGCTQAASLSYSQVDFDARGLIVKNSKTMEDGSLAEQILEYDVVGRNEFSSVWASNASTAAGTTQVYDALDRVIQTIQPDGQSISTYYDDQGTWAVATTANTMLIDEFAERPVTHTQHFDAWGRMYLSAEAKESDTDGNGVVAEVISTYAYDHADRLIHFCIGDVDTRAQTCPQSRRRVFEYDGRGFLVAEWHPEIFAGGGYSPNHSDDATYYAYRATGSVYSKNPPGDDFDVTLTYDAADRLTQIRDLDGNLLSEFFWARSNVAGLSTHRLVATRQHQRVVTQTGTAPQDAVVTEHFRYDDPEGLFTDYAVQTTLGTRFETAVNGYDALANPLGIRYPTCALGLCGAPARDSQFGYGNGYLTGVDMDLGPQTVPILNAVSYQPNGAIAQLTHGNDLIETHELANGWRLEQIDVPAIGWTHGPMAFDGAGNVAGIDADRYYYDGLGRLRFGEVTANSQVHAQAVTYDDYANIRQIQSGTSGASPGTVTNAVVRDLSVDSVTNRLTSHSASYDEAGNLRQLLIGADRFSYGYDAQGRMTSLEQTAGNGSAHNSYLYTASGERLATLNLASGISTWTPRSADNHVLRRFERTSGGGWQVDRDYVFAGNRQVAAVDAAGQTRHFHLDHLNSTRRITNDTGQLVVANDYYPFGGYISANDDEPLQFTGHERDAVSENTDTDLDYMHARYYTPELGRFLAVDPVLGEIGRGQSWNRYVYAVNSPTTAIDPDGLCATQGVQQSSDSDSSTCAGGESLEQDSIEDVDTQMAADPISAVLGETAEQIMSINDYATGTADATPTKAAITAGATAYATTQLAGTTVATGSTGIVKLAALMTPAMNVTGGASVAGGVSGGGLAAMATAEVLVAGGLFTGALLTGVTTGYVIDQTLPGFGDLVVERPAEAFAFSYLSTGRIDVSQNQHDAIRRQMVAAKLSAISSSQNP